MKDHEEILENELLTKELTEKLLEIADKYKVSKESLIRELIHQNLEELNKITNFSFRLTEEHNRLLTKFSEILKVSKASLVRKALIKYLNILKQSNYNIQ